MPALRRRQAAEPTAARRDIAPWCRAGKALGAGLIGKERAKQRPDDAVESLDRSCVDPGSPPANLQRHATHRPNRPRLLVVMLLVTRRSTSEGIVGKCYFQNH